MGKVDALLPGEGATHDAAILKMVLNPLSNGDRLPLASAASVRPMEYAVGLCRKPHVCRPLARYHIYKFL